MEKKKQLKVIITSGGTIVKLDDVRHIGNFSGGMTACLIAEEFLRQGARVHYVHSPTAKRPFRRNFEIDPEKSLDREIERIRALKSEFDGIKADLKEYCFETFEEYLWTVRGLAEKPDMDVIVLAAAVSDYGAPQKSGKISSDKDELLIKLTRNEKIISLVKKLNPRIFLVGFKLMSGATPRDLIETAYRHGLKNSSNLTVANSVSNGEFMKRINYVVTPEKGVIPVSLGDLPETLAQETIKRVQGGYYKTLCSYAFYNFFPHDEIFKETVMLKRLNLFEPYFEKAGAQFGFIAKRWRSDSFVISARGSNKEALNENEAVIVNNVDFEKRIVEISTRYKKASLNAPVAGKIFKCRRDANLILHAHISLNHANRTKTAFAPGTAEDIDEIMKYLSRGEKIVELKDHGVIILGKDMDEIIDILAGNSVYARRPEFYDLVYDRFQRKDDFVELVLRETGPEAAVLDLAGGTGEVAGKLLEKNYTDISLADRNEAMLRIAEKKLGGKATLFVSDMEKIKTDKVYDAITIRQAVNYLLSERKLAQAFREIYARLKPGGRLIFNAPNYKGETGRDYPAVQYPGKIYKYRKDGWDITTTEMNHVDGRIIIHTQRSVLFREDGSGMEKVYDLNRFRLYTKEDFVKALRAAGFKNIEFYYHGLDRLDNNSKSLYCVVRKDMHREDTGK